MPGSVRPQAPAGSLLGCGPARGTHSVPTLCQARGKTQLGLQWNHGGQGARLWEAESGTRKSQEDLQEDQGLRHGRLQGPAPGGTGGVNWA